MDEWLVLIGANATALGALGLTLRFRRRKRVTVSLGTARALASAVAEADRRGHRPVSLTHLALGLLAEPAIATELERRGVSLRELYIKLDACLPPVAESRTKTDVPNGVEPSVEDLLKQSGATAPPGEVLSALLRRSDERAASVFAAHGIAADGWGIAVGWPRRGAKEPPTVAGPYRTAPVSNESTDVVFWDDNRTTQEFVEHVVSEVFALAAPEPRRLTLAVGDDGFAIVGTYERGEARRLARRATELARARGFPLVVSVEDAGGVLKMSGLQRWRRRRTARLVIRDALQE